MPGQASQKAAEKAHFYQRTPRTKVYDAVKIPEMLCVLVVRGFFSMFLMLISERPEILPTTGVVGAGNRPLVLAATMIGLGVFILAWGVVRERKAGRSRHR